MIKFRYKRKDNASLKLQSLDTSALESKKKISVLALKRANSSDDILDSPAADNYHSQAQALLLSCIDAVIVCQHPTNSQYIRHVSMIDFH
jgi:hypothetical protein